jgi:NAD(P)-dependent dehydrogenase (short-subunit alcohol dehydrogenase family)
VNTEDLHGKTAVVTGAASGIGREIALLAARRGADLALCDLDEDGLAEVEGQAARMGRSVLTQRVDVSERDQVRAFAEAVHGGPGAVDLLVNNAGVGLVADFLDTELSDWDWIVGINLMGVVHGCHFFLPDMVQRGRGGHVVNISSMAGYSATPALTAYCATKFGVLGMSEALREELRPHGIGVTAVCPGVINTPITRNSRARGKADNDETRERYVKVYEQRNYGPDRVARNVFKSIDRGRVVAPVSPEAWGAYAVKRISPRALGWVGRKISEQTG